MIEKKHTFDFNKIEKKWQKFWCDNQTFKTHDDFSKEKFYVLDMFPYPSAAGLHVGHVEGYTATDIVARMKRMQGFNVLHPTGWDAFGLPAEQFAILTGNDPAEFTKENIANFRRQFMELGLSYDFDREVDTTDPNYFKWTQWIFMQLYNRGLAQVHDVPVNWCPELGTVLANEEVIDGKSERGGFPVYRKNMKQWVLKITHYAERLLDDLDLCSWPESTKQMQINWIGKSEGAKVFFSVENSDDKIEVFTTRADTLFGATYLVLAPEHPLVANITRDENKTVVEEYQQICNRKSDLERSELSKEKTGVFTGTYAINPINGNKIPIWIADYVLVTYGTGAVMAVPAHDQRDYEFAKKFNLDIIKVIENSQEDEAYTGDGLHINSGFIDGMNNQEANATMIKYLEQNQIGESKVQYKLRDWLFARQRYWGEPFPVIHFEDGTMMLEKEENLPITLPKMKKIAPSGNGESPLALADEWLEVDGADYGKPGVKGRRDTNTMPQWAGSCWYYLRFIDPDNENALIDPEKEKYWMNVDLYVGGAEHAVLHLLYARFWHKVLYDIGVVSTKEPFKKLFHQGMILGSDGEKMSKSKGNVVNPDEIIAEFGADTLRLYEMFMGPLESSLAWSTTALEGSHRWLERVYRLFVESDKVADHNDHKLDRSYHETVKKVTSDFESLKFNTAISQMMIFINDAYKQETVYVEYVKGFIKLLSCICPHLGEELWAHFGGQDSIAYESFPTYDESYLVQDEVTVIVQVNGKMRAKLEVFKGIDQSEIEKMATNHENVEKYLLEKTVVKVIYVPDKLLNIVVK